MKRRSDEEISAPLYAYDAAIRAEYGCFAGVDEAGRGPLCGPVCVAAKATTPSGWKTEKSSPRPTTAAEFWGESPMECP